jgi:hypothetical protein
VRYSVELPLVFRLASNYEVKSLLDGSSVTAVSSPFMCCGQLFQSKTVKRKYANEARDKRHNCVFVPSARGSVR